MSENNKRDLELREWTLTSTINHFKTSLENAEAELKEVVEALKVFAIDSAETVQAVAETVVEKVEEVAVKVEEAVEVVKEEVKKAAPKKAAAKKAEPATEESDK